MLELEIFVTRPVNVVSGKASIDTSTESPRCTRTTSVSSTRTFAWMTDRSETVSSSPTSLENVPGTATSPSSTASRVTRPDIGAVMWVLRRLSRASWTAARDWSTWCSAALRLDRKSTRLNSSHSQISYAVFCLKKKKICPRNEPPKRAAAVQHKSGYDGEVQEVGVWSVGVLENCSNHASHAAEHPPDCVPMHRP